MKSVVFESHSTEDTMRIGGLLADHLVAGDVVAISGELGAGKTHLCKGIAAGLEVDPDIVNSPTFVLLQQYEGKLPIFHIDAYRLGDVSEFEEIGGVEILDGEGVSLVEWPERIEELLPRRTIRVGMEAHGVESRCLTVSGNNDHSRQFVARIDVN